MRLPAQALFDEIGTALAELDRFSAPQLESIERQLATMKTEADARLAETEQKLRQLQATVSELASNCERLNQELRAREAQIFQLQVELSERIKESDQLRRQLDSIQASVCWRLTWPIRWLHKQAIRTRTALSKQHFL